MLRDRDRDRVTQRTMKRKQVAYHDSGHKHIVIECLEETKRN